MFGHDTANTNYAPNETGPKTDLSETWRFNLAEEEGVGSQVVADGTLYIGGNALYALDATTGEEQWRFQGEFTGVVASAVVDGSVYFGDDRGVLHAVDAATGEQQWSQTVNEFVQPTVADGTIFFGFYGEVLYALDSGTGDELWTLEVDGNIFTTPAVADGSVYVNTTKNTLYSVDITSGEQQWTTPDVESRHAPSIANGTVYIGNTDGNLQALDTANGQQQWEFETAGGRGLTTPAIADGSIYTWQLGESTFYALSVAEGNQEWQSRTRFTRVNTQAVVDGAVYLVEEGGYEVSGPLIRVLDTTDGSTLSTLPASEDSHVPTSSPAVADGTVYLATETAVLAVS